MTCELAIMNQRGLVLAADSATTVTYYDNGGTKRVRYFKGANKLFQLSAVHPVGLMIYGAGSLHNVPWEIVVREFRRTLGGDSCDRLSSYAERFFEFVRGHAALFPDELRAGVLLGAARRAAVKAVKDAQEAAAEQPEDAGAFKAALSLSLDQVRESECEPPVTPEDVEAAVAAQSGTLLKELEIVAGRLEITDLTVLPILAEFAVRAVMKRYPEFLDATGIVIGGYGEADFFPSFEHYRFYGFLHTSVIRKRQDGHAISTDYTALIDCFAIRRMIDTFRMGIGEDTYGCVVEATGRMLTGFAGKVRDAVAPGTDIPGLDDLVTQASESHRKDWYMASAERHYHPLARVIGSLPVAEMGTLAKTLIELESLKERVTQDSESVAGPIDVAAITKHDGFIWLDRKHYFRPELNPRFFERQASHDRS